MQNDTKVWLRVEQKEDGKIKCSRIIEFNNGASVQVPVNQDGAVKWFDDTVLIKPEYRK